MRSDRSTGVIASAVEVGAGIAAAATLGFVLGVAITSVWERFSDPQVADIGHAYGSTGIPTSRFDDITRGRGAALLERWLSLSSKPSTRIALIPTSPKLEPMARHAAEWLSELHSRRTRLLERGEDGVQAAEPRQTAQPAPAGAAEPSAPGVAATQPAGRVPWRSRWHAEERSSVPAPDDASQLEASTQPEGKVHPPAGDLVLVTTGSSDPESTPEGEAQRSDVIVLLVDTNTRGKDLMESVWTLEHFGHRPEWILLVDSVRKSRRAMKRERSKGVS